MTLGLAWLAKKSQLYLSQNGRFRLKITLLDANWIQNRRFQ